MDEKHSPMGLALEAARAAAQQDEVPVGAVIVDQAGHVYGPFHNLCEQQKDPTAHAEMLAIQAVCAVMGTQRLTDCDLYVTLEPCPMCAAAIAAARIRRLYFGAYDPKSGGVEHGARIFEQPSCHHQPEVIGGVDEAQCAELMRDFFVHKR